MDARHPVLRLWIRSAEVRGMSLRELEHNNYDRCVNEVFNLENGLCCVQSGVSLTKFGHRLLLFLHSLIICERADKNSC